MIGLNQGSGFRGFQKCDSETLGLCWVSSFSTMPRRVVFEQCYKTNQGVFIFSAQGCVLEPSFRSEFYKAGLLFGFGGGRA